MEERQTKIREGAGLEESRLNTEFIELLKKWSTPILLVIVAISGSYFLWNNYQRAQERGIDQAFIELDAAVKSGSPASLLRVADEHNRKAVPILARLAAADIHLNAARTGVPIGATFQEGKPGVLSADTPPLTDEQREQEIAKAEELYKRVHDSTRSNIDHAIHTIAAMNGLAACAEMRGQADAARGFYQQVIDLCKKIGFEDGVKVAESMIESLSIVKNPPRVYAEAALPKAASDLQPFISPMTNIKMIGADGKEIPSDGVTIAPTPPPTPAPNQPAPSGGGDEPE